MVPLLFSGGTLWDLIEAFIGLFTGDTWRRHEAPAARYLPLRHEISQYRARLDQEMSRAMEYWDEQRSENDPGGADVD